MPEDTALRIRLDDTLTSADSQVGDPFSATVVDQGDYRNARVYGHVAEIDMSGKVRGRTSMMLRFDRLVMSDGRRSPIHAEIVELYHAPSGEKSTSKARSNPAAEDGKASNTPPSGPERAPYWVESSAGARGQGSGRSLVVLAGWARPPSMAIRRSRSIVVRR